MTSNHRSHKIEAMRRTARFMGAMMWHDLKYLLDGFNHKKWRKHYKSMLNDVQCEAYLAEAREKGYAVLSSKDFEFEEIPF